MTGRNTQVGRWLIENDYSGLIIGLNKGDTLMSGGYGLIRTNKHWDHETLEVSHFHTVTVV